MFFTGTSLMLNLSQWNRWYAMNKTKFSSSSHTLIRAFFFFFFVSVEKSCPNLTQGAYSPSLRYQSSDVLELVAYATQRGVRVIPEFDTPGHSYSWGIGYPITASCPDWSKNVNNVPLNPAHQQTFQIVEQFFDEMMSLFSDSFFHQGGDEVSEA
jgi:hexosaminidase